MTTPALVSAGSVASDTSSVTPSFGQSTTAGNLLVAWAQSDDPATGSFPITIDSGSEENGWAFIASAGAANGYNWAGFWYKADCGSGETAPTFSDSGYQVNAGLTEYSGVATSSPLDQYGAASDADPGVAGGVDSAGGDLIVGISCWNGGNADDEFGQHFNGSDGSQLSSEFPDTQTNATGVEPAGLLYQFGHGIGPAVLGSHANQVTATSTEFENSVSHIIASFLAAS